MPAGIWYYGASTSQNANFSHNQKQKETPMDVGLIFVVFVAFIAIVMLVADLHSGTTRRSTSGPQDLSTLRIPQARNRTRHSPRDALKLANELDLSIIRTKVMQEYGWSEERTVAAETEYRKFLYLAMMHPDETIVPWNDAEGNDDLDKFWHRHILDTSKYARDCNKLFGRYFHHDPHSPLRPGDHAQATARTRTWHNQEFVRPASAAPATSPDFLTGMIVGQMLMPVPSSAHEDDSHRRHSDVSSAGAEGAYVPTVDGSSDHPSHADSGASDGGGGSDGGGSTGDGGGSTGCAAGGGDGGGGGGGCGGGGCGGS